MTAGEYTAVGNLHAPEGCDLTLDRLLRTASDSQAYRGARHQWRLSQQERNRS
jgi:hypothetical protein